MNRLSARAPVALLLLLSTFFLSSFVVAGPATAAACAPGTGVTVVVGSDVRCAGGGGRSAASAFGATGHSLTRVQRQPGFVCKVDGFPSSSCVNTPPSDAYWGLFWSNGKTGHWTYASSGVDSLSIPKGGWVGFAFQRGSGRTYPGATPRVAAAPQPKPMPKPTTKPTAATATTAPTATATATAGPSSTPTPAKPSASAPATASPTPAVDAAPAAKSSSSGRLGWVAAAVMITLLLGMWVAMWRRRSSS